MLPLERRGRSARASWRGVSIVLPGVWALCGIEMFMTRNLGGGEWGTTDGCGVGIVLDGSAANLNIPDKSPINTNFTLASTIESVLRSRVTTKMTTNEYLFPHQRQSVHQ